MGIERIIRHDPAAVPHWEAVRAALATVGETPVVRMIDGQPAFPDEVPEPGWSELRVGLAGGMVTLRRLPGRLVTVTWGNADPALQRSWAALTFAAAEAVGGVIETDGGEASAADFARTIGLTSPG